ncbi:MAG TPA: hypothetical protein VGL93_16155 [Streptosporangiaceae bacterium]
MTTPYATLLRVIERYLHPEHYADMEMLQDAVKNTEGEMMRVFKEELRVVMRDPGVLPEGALAEAAEYEDGSERKFLDRLWRELYGDEPV